jgi:hypothetical protein
MKKTPRTNKSVFCSAAFPAAGLVVLWILGFSGCKTFNMYETESRPRSRPIVIDGKSDDWQGDLFVVEGERVSAGFLNDGKYLYVCFLTSDPAIRYQIMMLGFTIWFDPKGGKEKAFGITYPVGPPPGQQTAPKMGAGGEMAFDDLSGAPLAELEIVKSEKEAPVKMKIEEAKGIEIKAASSTGLFVYELKIPLMSDGESVLAVGTPPGKTVGIGFETGKFDASKMPKNNQGGIPQGANRPPTGGMAGRGGMGGARMGTALLETLKVWAVVQLAPGPGAPVNLEGEPASRFPLPTGTGKTR